MLIFIFLSFTFFKSSTAHLPEKMSRLTTIIFLFLLVITISNSSPIKRNVNSILSSIFGLPNEQTQSDSSLETTNCKCVPDDLCNDARIISETFGFIENRMGSFCENPEYICCKNSKDELSKQ